MDGFITISSTQMLVAWTILGVLSTWMVTFTILALHSLSTEKRELEALSTASGSFPAISVQATLPNGSLAATFEAGENGQRMSSFTSPGAEKSWGLPPLADSEAFNASTLSGSATTETRSEVSQRLANSGYSHRDVPDEIRHSH